MRNPPKKWSEPGFVLQLNEDIFYEYFEPYRHPDTKSQCWGGVGLLCFGSDVDIAYNIEDEYLWTLSDGCDDGSMCITPGLHFANRVNYLVTKMPHHNLDIYFPVIYFPVERRNRGLSAVGVSRQLSTLKRYFAFRGYL